jgi:GABA permease
MSTRQVLIVANQTAGGSHLIAEVERRVKEGPCEFYIVAPAKPPPGSLTWDEAEVRDAARRRLETALGRLRAVGAAVDGEVGDYHPMAAVRDVFLRRRFDEVIVSTFPPGVSEWLKLDLPSRIQRASGLPVTHVRSSE